VTGGLRWKLQRVRSMSPAELAWRVGQRLRLASWEARAGRPVAPLASPAGGFRAAFQAASAPLVPAVDPLGFERAFPGETARILARAEAVEAGRVELFARGYELGPDPSRWPWNRSPDGGPEVPGAFGPTLDYRDPARAGDARLAWELGRHGFLVPVAQAAWLTGDPRHARFVFEALEAWIQACPPYRGIQWASALEYALRSFSWGFALALVARTAGGAEIAEARWERVFATWAEQLRFVAAHDARHSSANNHRLGEAAGLAWGGRLLSFVPEGAGFRERGLRLLEESFLAQTTPDGVTREHAFAYQQFVLDFVVLVETLESRAGRAVPGEVAERIRRVATSLDAFSPGGRTFPVGDGDEGQALPTGEPFEARVSASLECAALLLGERGWDAPQPRALWLGWPSSAGAGMRPAPAGVETYGGYGIARQGVSRLLFDAAELGLAPLYAHGHADALMVLLDVDGPRLVDPGTGGYHAHAELRERLRSTRAHNTVEVDGQSQSTPGGLFQWLKAARIVEPLAVDGAAMSAAHDGDARPGVTHRRSVRMADGAIVVEDTLAGTGTHRAVTRWHLGDGRATKRPGEGASYEAHWPDGFTMRLRADLPEGSETRAGDEAVWAPRFLEPRPCGVVEWIVEGRLPLTWRTTLLLGDAQTE
jgi:hypothetical protein